MTLHPSMNKSRKGFTLVELAVVIVIIGVLAAFGVPKFLNSVERSKASEAVAYLSAVQTAQERYIAQQGVYADNVSKLDITVTPPKYFDTDGSITAQQDATGNATWTMTLGRKVSSSSFGSYSVIFTQNGFDATNSTISGFPAINPFGTTTTTTTTSSS